MDGWREQGSTQSLLRPWKLQEFHFWDDFLKNRDEGRGWQQGDPRMGLVLGP